MRLNFRLGWFRVEVFPKFRVVFDTRRNAGTAVAPIAAAAAVGMTNMFINRNPAVAEVVATTAHPHDQFDAHLAEEKDIMF